MYKLITLITAFLIITNTAQAGVREDWQTVSDAIASSGNTSAAAKIEAAVDAIPDEDLDKIYGNVDLNQLAEKFRNSAQAIEVTEQAIIEAGMSREALAIGKSAGLPNAQGYPANTAICNFSPNRSDADMLISATIGIQASRVVLEGAKGLWAGLSRACEQDILGVNTSLACIPADLVLFAAEILVGIAETAVDTINACDGAVDAAEIEGSYERLGHLHTDLSIHDASIKTQISTHDTEIKSQVSTHDTEIKTRVSTHDTDIKNQLSTHDTEIKALLATMQAGVGANDVKLDILLARQLEIVRLLHTPHGLRATDIPACNGGPCTWPFYVNLF